MKFISVLAAALAIVGLLASGATAGERYGQQKVVYHNNYDGGDGGKKYGGAMRNIQNHINAVGAGNMDIKVKLHGNGPGLLVNAKSSDKPEGAVAKPEIAERLVPRLRQHAQGAQDQLRE